MENPETEAVMNLLYSASICASFICPRLHFLLLCRMMHLTLDHGITGASTTAMAWFGVLMGHRYAEYRLGFQYGTLARELVTRHGYDAFEAKTLLPLDQLSVWTQPLSFTIECAKACFTSAVTHGDMTMACFAACHQVINFLSRGDHLDGVLTSIDRGLAFVRKTHFQDVETILMVQRGYVEFLRTPVIGTWTASQVLPEALLPASPEQAPEQTSTMLFWYWLYRGMAHFTCGVRRRAGGSGDGGLVRVVCAGAHPSAGLPSLQRAGAFASADAGDLLGEPPPQHSRPLRQNRPLGAH
jgi:hypothetical protein